nr:hemagglutinin repeat-containing protein [Variovorax sp. IB41]
MAITADADPSQTLVNDAGKLDAGRLALKVSNLTNTGGGEIVQTGTDATAIAVSGTLDNSDGRIASNGSLALAAATLRNRDGTVRTAATADLALTVKGLADNAGGDIASGNDLSIHAGTLGNDAGRITAAGSASGTVDGAAGNKGGTIASNGAMRLGAGSLDNSAGTVSGAEGVTVDIAGALNNTDGTVVTHRALSLKAGSLDNAAGVVRSIHSTAQLDVSGALANSKGQIDAATDLDVKAGAVANTGSLRGTHDITMNVGGDLANDGNITAGRNNTVTAGSVKAGSAGVFGAGIQADGTLGATGALSVRAGGALAAQGRNLAAGDAALQGASVDVSGSQTSAANIALTATRGDVTTSKAAVVTPGTLVIAANNQAAQALVNAGGQLNANQLDLKLSNLANTNGGEIVQVGMAATTIAVAGTLNNDGGRIASNGRDLSLGAGGAMTNAAGRIEHAAPEGQGTLTLKAGSFSGPGGQITGNGAFVANVAGAFDQHAGTTRARAIAIDAGSLGNRGGQIVQSGTDATRIAIVGAIDNSDGTIASNGHMNVAAGSLANHGGTVRAAGAASLDLAVAGSLDNSSNGVIGAGGNGTIAAGLLNNDTGSVTAAGDLRATVGGAASNVGGMLAANGNTTLVADTLDNSKGTAAAVKGDLSVSTKGATTNDAGTLQAAARVALKNGGLGNIGGRALGDSLSVDTHGHALDNTQGTLAAATTVALNSGALVNAAGLIQSGGAMAIDTNGKALTNTHAAGHASKQGGIASADTLDLKTGSIDNAAGFIGAKNALTASTQAQAFSNTKAGLVLGQSTVAIDTHGAAYDNSGGQTMAAGDLRIGAGSLGNTAGLIRSMATTTLDAGGIDNHGTQGKDQGIEGKAVAIAASGLNNASGAIRADADTTVTSSGTVDNTGGLISGGGTVAIADPHAADPAAKTLNLVNTNGSLVGDQHLKIDAATFSGDGQLVAGKDLSIALKQDIVNSAELSAHGNLAYTTTGNFANHGKLMAGQALTVGGRDVDNAAGAEMSGTDTTVNAGGTLTNRGLIDSNGNTRIDASAVKNIGTGRIYGNQVSIATGTLDNDAEAANGATKAGTIAARNTLNIGANAIHNREHALLLSAGAGADAMRIGAALDANRLATGQGGLLDNLSADIESLGGLSVSMANVNNRDVHIERGEPASESSMLVTYAPKLPTMGHSGFYLPEQVRLDPANGQVFLKKPDGTEELVGVGGYGQWTAAVVTTRETARNIDPARMAAAGDITVSGRLLNQDSQVSAGGTVQAGPYAPEQMQGESTTTVGPTIVINEKGGFEPMVLPQTKKDTVSLGAYKYEPNVNAANGTKPDAAVTAGGNGAAGAAGAAGAGGAGGIGSVTTGHGAATIVEVPATVGAVVSVTGQSTGKASAAAVPQGVAAVSVSASGVVHVDGTAAAQAGAGVDRVSAIQGGNAGVGTVTTGAAVHAEAAPGGVPAPQTGQADATRVSTGAAVTPEASTARAGATRTIPMVVRTSSPNTSIPRASLFNIHPEAGSRYVVETDPRFANYREWLGSDYLLNNLGLDPNTTLKRLGDGFYEQKLIREQVAQLTGYRFLEGFASDDDQYTTLMNSGATFARQYGLRPGIALTAAQMAQLTCDIVWLVEQTVTLPDGSTQQALAPQVYVRVRPGDIDGAGALLSADATVIKSKGDVVNTGTIAGRTLVAINAENVKNLGGRIAGSDVGISARNDLENIGGSITARDSAVLTAGRDIRIETTTKTATQPGTSRTDIDRVAGVYVTDPGGVLIANAGNDVKVIAGVLSNKGADSFTSVTAGRNIELGTVTESQSRLTMLGATGFRGDASSKEIGSTVAGNGTVLLDAKGGNIDARAATIDAGPGVLGLTAAGNVNIAAGEETASVVERSQSKEKRKLKSTTSTLVGDATSSTSIGSRLSGGSVGVFAGGDIDVVGSDIEARKNATLKAAGNVNIVAAQDSLSASLDTTRTTKGFIAPKLGGSSIDRKLATAQHAAVSSQTEQASRIAAGENLNITAGSEVTVYASDLSAGDDLKVTGREVNVLSGTNASSRELGTSSAKGSIGTMGNFKRAGKGMNGKESVTDSVTQTTLAPATLSGRNVTLTATDGDLTLDAARIHAGEQVTLNAAKGRVNMGVVTTTTEVGQSRGESDPMYQRTRESGAHVEAANYTRIDSQALKVQAPKMNVEVAQHTFNGQSATPSTSGTQQTIDQLLAMQRNQPGMGWLQQVQNDAALNRLQIEWQAVPLTQRQWAQSQGSLTGAGGAVVAIVATVLTWGAASGIGAAVGGTVGGTTGAVVSAAVSAGVSSIAAQAAVSLINNNNNGNVGAVLEELTSSQGIKGIVSAMATAGALQGLNIGLGINDYTAANIGRTLPDGTTVGWQQVLQRNLIDSVSGGIVNSAIQGTSVEQGIKRGLLNGLLNTAASGSAHWIGANGPNGEQNLNALASEAAHAIAGCLVGAGRASAGSGGGMSSGDGCSAGAVGAVVGHLTGQIYNPNADPQYAERTIQLGQMVAGIAGALVGGTQGAADIASGAGANAVENNWLSQKNPKGPMYTSQQQQYDAAVAACNGGRGSADACATMSRLASESATNESALRAACDAVTGSANACAAQTQLAQANGNTVVTAGSGGSAITYTTGAYPKGYPTLGPVNSPFYNSWHGQQSQSLSDGLVLEAANQLAGPLVAPIARGLGAGVDALAGWVGGGEVVTRIAAPAVERTVTAEMAPVALGPVPRTALTAIYRDVETGLNAVNPTSSVSRAEVDRLAWDTAAGKARPGEGNAAAQYQNATGSTLERVNPADYLPGTPKPDFVIVSGPNAGQKVDFMFAVDSEYAAAGMNNNFLKTNKDVTAMKNQLIDHAEKADVVPLDFRKLTAENQQLLLDRVISLLSPAEQAKLLILR